MTAGLNTEWNLPATKFSEYDDIKNNRGSIEVDTKIQRDKKGWIPLLFCNNQVYVVSLQEFLCCPTLQELSTSYSSHTPPYNLVKKVKIIFILYTQN